MNVNAMFLRRWAVDRSVQEITHVKMIGGVCSRLFVPPHDRRAFYALCTQCPEQCIAEVHSNKLTPKEEAFVRLFFDLDMDKDEVMGVLDAETVMNLVGTVHAFVLKLLFRRCSFCRSLDCDTRKLIENAGGCCSSCKRFDESAGIVCMSGPSEAGKVGVHIIYPYVVLSLKDCMVLTNMLSRKLAALSDYCKRVCVLDPSVYRPGTSLRMPMMDKPKAPAGAKRYVPVAVLDGEGANNTDSLERLESDPLLLFQLTSIRVDNIEPELLKRYKSQSKIVVSRAWRKEHAESQKDLISTSAPGSSNNPLLPVPDDLRAAIGAISIFKGIRVTGYRRMTTRSICVYTSCRRCPNVKKTKDNPMGEHRSRCLWISISDTECVLKCFNRKKGPADLQQRHHGPCSEFRLPRSTMGPTLPQELIDKYVIAPKRAPLVQPIKRARTEKK